MFAGNLLKYLRSCLSSLSDCNCHIEKAVDKSKLSENRLSGGFTDK